MSERVGKQKNPLVNSA